jgi:hypothetical protein
MDVLRNDLRVAVRLLVRRPAFSVTAIAALMLGIGASTAIFSVVNAVVLKPFAFPEPDQIVMFQNTYKQFSPTGSASPTEFNWWRRQTGTFQDVSAYDFGSANLANDAASELIPIVRVSADYFRLGAAHPLYGRTFTAADDAPNVAKTIVLAHGLWQRRFGSDPSVIGKRITLNDTPF